MNNLLSPGVSPYANTVSPHSTLGREAVGLESAEAKNDLFSPVEEIPETEKPLNNDDNEQEQANQKSDNSAQGDQNSQAKSDAQQAKELEQISVLKAVDMEVRAHEQAHSSVGGQYASAPSYSYVIGPDGVKYAVSGEVAISLPANNGAPEQTIRAADQIARAALAPARPSDQDRMVAANALQMAAAAKTQLNEQLTAERRLAAAETREDQAARDLKEEQRKTRIESMRSNSFLKSNLSTSENVSGAPSQGQLFDQSA